MAADTTGGDTDGEKAAAETLEATMRRMDKEIRGLQRKLFHQREKFLLLQQGMNSLAAALADRPDLGYPEELKPVTFVDGSRDDVLFLAFGGVNMAIGMPPFEFLASLTDKGVPGYFIKDFRQSWYHEGLLGLSDDMDGTEAYLRSLVERHKPSKLVTLGASAGGYAAIVFGCRLGADRVAAFSPQTDVNAHVVSQYASYDTPPPAQFLDREKSVPMKRFLKQQEKLPEIRIYYGAENRNDAQDVGRLAGIDGVHLKPMEGVTQHSIAGELKRRGLLAGILEELIAF